MSGPASATPLTVNTFLKKTALKFTDQPALRVKRNGEWRTWTWKDYYADVARGAKALIKLGLEPHHGVCILGFNSPEWFISLLSAIMVTIYFISTCVCVISYLVWSENNYNRKKLPHL